MVTIDLKGLQGVIFDLHICRKHGLASFGQYTFSRAYGALGCGGYLNGIYSWDKAEHTIVHTARN